MKRFNQDFYDYRAPRGIIVLQIQTPDRLLLQNSGRTSHGETFQVNQTAHVVGQVLQAEACTHIYSRSLKYVVAASQGVLPFRQAIIPSLGLFTAVISDATALLRHSEPSAASKSFFYLNDKLAILRILRILPCLEPPAFRHPGCFRNTVRRQGFWHQRRLKLRESSAHLVDCIMRRACCDASVAFRVSLSVVRVFGTKGGLN